MPVIHQPEDGTDYSEAGQRAFQFFRRHSDDAYSSPTLMHLASQCVNGQAPYVIIDETPARIDRLTETKNGGVRAAAVILSDNRVLLATRERFRRQGIGAEMLRTISSYIAIETGTLQFWVATRNLQAMRFLIGNSLELIATTPSTSCFGFDTYGDERAWPR